MPHGNWHIRAFHAVSIGAGHLPFSELIADRSHAAMTALNSSLSRWSSRPFNLQLAVAVYVRVWIFLYQGEEFVSRAWAEVKSSHYLLLSGTRQ